MSGSPPARTADVLGNAGRSPGENAPGGTFLNGERIREAKPLRNGDVIRVGKCTLSFGERRRSRGTVNGTETVSSRGRHA